MWLILPLVYFLAWWQTGSLRQAFNATIAWIVGFGIVALALLAMDVGGFSGLTATPDSPAAGIAILGGFIGMWVSNILWRRRGGDPPRKMGKWERTFRAVIGQDEKKKKKKKRPAMQQPVPQQQIPPPPPPQQQPVAAAPVDAHYRPAEGPSTQAPQQSNQPQQQQAPPPQQPPGPAPQFQQAPAGPPASGQYAAQQQPPTPVQVKKKSTRKNSPTADKYAKATGRALGAMFRGSNKKKSRGSTQK